MSTPQTPIPFSTQALSALQTAIPMLEGIAALFIPGGQAVIAGLTVVQISNLLNGIIAGVPEVEALVSAVKNWAAGGAPPTADQWKVLDTSYDAASAELAAADAKVIAGT